MNARITKLKTGEVLNITRDCAVEHPDWVHEQLETTSEVQLQELLDLCERDGMWYEDGEHQGPDFYGLEMFYSETEHPACA